MTRTRAATRLALAIAVGWSASCAGGKTAYRAASTEPAGHPYSPATPHPGAPLAEEGSLDRPGLGTEFGEQVDSRVVDQPFERASSEPFAQVAVHYNDPAGIEAQLRSRAGHAAPVSAYTPQGGVTITLTDEAGVPLPGFEGPVRTYVIGQVGQRYNIRIENHSDARYEVVASVDGLDVIDGRPAHHARRGYLVQPRAALTIDGFRTSRDTVAAFRFSAVRDSYASRTGDDRNVGVIGFAFFAELGSHWDSGDGDDVGLRESADPFPGRYAEPPP